MINDKNLFLLLSYIYDFPAHKEYFIKPHIFYTDTNGERQLLSFHKYPGKLQSFEDLIVYCDKVRVGETLQQALKRALRDDLGIEEIIKIDYTTEFESDHNKKGELLPRVVLQVEIAKHEFRKNPFPNLSVSWTSAWTLNNFLNAPSPEELDEVVKKLTELHYFKYVPQNELEQAQQSMRKNLKEGFLETGFSEASQDESYSRDRRSYLADQENLHEGSMYEVILSMKDVLAKEGVSIESARDEIENDDKHYLFINGEKFEIYTINQEILSSKGEGYYWLIATKRLLEIVNSLLEKAGSSARLYGYKGGNDAEVVLLTEDLYYYMRELTFLRNNFYYSSEDLQDMSF